jgi:hypothetical protein
VSPTGPFRMRGTLTRQDGVGVALISHDLGFVGIFIMEKPPGKGGFPIREMDRGRHEALYRG